MVIIKMRVNLSYCAAHRCLLVRCMDHDSVTVDLGRVGLLLLQSLLHIEVEVFEVMNLRNIIASEFTVLVIEFVNVRDHQIN